MSLARLVSVFGRLPPSWSILVTHCDDHPGEWLVVVGRPPFFACQGHGATVDEAAERARAELVPHMRGLAEVEASQYAMLDDLVAVADEAIGRCRPG